jgi:NAD(P)-dependent dehydrogenase (short-subunit alcohol dehydrogenase family)
MARALADLLRANLLDGQVVAVAGSGSGSGGVGAAVAVRCAALGAATAVLDAPLLDEEAVTRAAAALGRVDTLACDAGAAFVTAGGGLEGLRAGLDGSWNATRAVANAAWRLRASESAAAGVAPPAAAHQGASAGGKLVLIAPPAAAGAHAGALGAALENLARTLSVEWARYGIRTAAILPGGGASDDDLATLVAYLASPAGDYFSGCVFTVCGSDVPLLRPA